MKATVHVFLKPGVLDVQGKAVENALHGLGVLDVQGKAVENALHGLGWPSVKEARVGRVIEFDLDATDAEAAKAEVKTMCEKLLANTVIESYRIDIA